MRVISGIYKRRRFDVPNTFKARPTTDFAKENLFNVLCNNYIDFEDGVTAAFSMEAFAPNGGRRTRIMGTRGFLDGDGHQFTVTEFGTMKKHVWNKKVSEIPEYKDAGHGGGDHGLLRDFLEAVCWNDVSRLTSSVDVSVESHVMGFDAEKSSKNGKKVKVKI